MSSARSLQRGLAVLVAIRDADAPLSVTDIARITRLDRGVIARLLPPLLDEGFVAPEGTSRSFVLGPAMGSRNGASTPVEMVDEVDDGPEAHGQPSRLSDQAVRVLQETGVPLSFREIVDALEAQDWSWSLRSAILDDDRIVRADKDTFTLANGSSPAHRTPRGSAPLLGEVLGADGVSTVDTKDIGRMLGLL